MLGSHDTFTFLKSTSCVYNHAIKWWKTQCKSIEEQYNFGVRFFDIRVCRNGNKWRLCHGIVNLKMTFPTLINICSYMDMKCPLAIYRIILEKGNYKDRKKFIKESQGLCNKYLNLWRVDIKAFKVWMGEVDNNNEVLFKLGYKFALVNTWESPAHELHGSITASNFYKTNLKKEAQKINSNLEFFKYPQKLKDMINSKDELYFIDYCTNEY